MSAASVNPHHLLVIDDNRDAAKVLATLLRVWGYEVRVAHSAIEGLQAAREKKPDCILSDIGMPGMDGYDLASKLRQDETLREIPLIAVSAFSDSERSLAAGFNQHVVKTADPATIKDILRKLLVMDKRLERAEELVQKQGEVMAEARDVMKEVHQDVKEIKQGLKEVKEDVSNVQEDLKQIKKELRDQE
ncbi:response regulator [Anatilimnocola sp. NA78]|uniref:response regulator n=1 Tax=Anatilimnocola sp. NA78 TaxID=3415683 RepID=UPI003CE522FC